MKATCCLILLLGSPLALAQDVPPSVTPGNPASFGTRDACLTECEGVYLDCKTECENSRARADEPHDEGPDLPVPECIDACKTDLKLCKEDC